MLEIYVTPKRHMKLPWMGQSISSLYYLALWFERKFSRWWKTNSRSIGCPLIINKITKHIVNNWMRNVTFSKRIRLMNKRANFTFNFFSEWTITWEKFNCSPLALNRCVQSLIFKWEVCVCVCVCVFVCVCVCAFVWEREIRVNIQLTVKLQSAQLYWENNINIFGFIQTETQLERC